jgi:hypothetical protein
MGARAQLFPKRFAHGNWMRLEDLRQSSLLRHARVRLNDVESRLSTRLARRSAMR